MMVMMCRYIKPGKERGTESRTCFGYGFSTEKCLPDQCVAGDWMCHDETDFIQESSIMCSVYDATLKQAGAVCVTGAGARAGGSGPAGRMNGTFELSTKTCSGMPVYIKEDEPNISMTMRKTAAGQWEWIVELLSLSGSEDRICLGRTVSTDVLLPHECAAKQWHCSDGDTMQLDENIRVELLSGSSIPEFALEMKDRREREWLGKNSARTEKVSSPLFHTCGVLVGCGIR